MKFFATAALIVAVQISLVQAACEAGGDNTCAFAEEQCLYRYTMDVSNPKNTKYIAALQEDPELKKGGEKWECFTKDDAEAKLAASKVKDKNTDVTMSYELKTVGSSAVMMKGAFVAATLGFISYM